MSGIQHERRMKIVIAPDSFKESLAAAAVAEALAVGIARVLPDAELVLVPLADGGEGTVDAFVAATHGKRHRRTVINPLGLPVEACFGLTGDGSTAVIEMAQASGLALVPPAMRNPALTTTYGTGELMNAALALGVRRLIIGVGGSATHDGGSGMLQSLGVQFLDGGGVPLAGYMNGHSLSQVRAIELGDLRRRLRGIEVIAACDVDNPLCGPLGAAAVFGPQKGAGPAQIAQLDQALGDFYALAVELGVTDSAALVDRAGAGAAGGVGAALLGFLAAELRPGVDLILEAIDLERHLADTDYLITGEGRIDSQTLHGKAPAGVARLAARYGVPVIAVGGSLSDDQAVMTSGLFDALEAAVYRPVSLADALADAERNLVFAGQRIGSWLRLLTLK